MKKSKIHEFLRINNKVMSKLYPFLFLILNSAFFILNSHAQGVWTQKASLAPTAARGGACGFSIGTKGYIGTGYTGGPLFSDFWEWNQTTNTWTQKANFGGGGRLFAISFSIGSKGYVGTGRNSVGGNMQDFWEYDQASDTWTQKASFGGVGRQNAIGFSIGTKGYIGIGYNGASTIYFDVWEWNQTTNIWTQKANFGGTQRMGAVTFSIGNKVYLGTGDTTYNLPYVVKDFWEYNPSTDTWIQKADFAGTQRRFAVGFSIGNNGYLGTGESNTLPGYNQDFWEYDTLLNTWAQKANLGGNPRRWAVGFSINNKGYIGTGFEKNPAMVFYNDFWEYTPQEFLSVEENQTQLPHALYPNPMSESATIEIKESGIKYQDLKFMLYDLQGKLVRQATINEQQTTIQRSNLSAGTYVYELTDGTKPLATGKLAIQ